MGKGIILRVLEGTQLSPEALKTLGQFLPDYQLELYKEKPDYQRSITRRVNSLYNAFLFVLEAYPPNPKLFPIGVEALKKYVSDCRKICDLSKSSLDELHKELEQFTARLIDVLGIGWGWCNNKKPHKEAMACLNEAEQYLLMSQGRPDLATVSSIEWGQEKKYVIQYDCSLLPYDEQIIFELNELKQQNYPKTPLWFNKLPEYQQVYFCHLGLNLIDPQYLKQDLLAFVDKLREFKKQSLNFEHDLTQISAEKSSLPHWFSDLKPSHQEMIRCIADKPYKLEDNLLNFINDLNKLVSQEEFITTVHQVPRIPHWYWVLSDRQQAFLSYVLKKASTVEDALSFLSSRHRTLPVPANFAVHKVLIMNKNGFIEYCSGARYRSSHIASRDGLSWPASVRKRHSTSNLNKVISGSKIGQPILFQTLISPIHLVDSVPDQMKHYMPELPPDLELYKIAGHAVESSQKSQKMVEANHPMNLAKYFYYTQADNKNSLRLLKEAADYMVKNGESTELKELCEEYKSVLNSSIGSATLFDYDGRELFLSSIEQLMILYMDGYSYGSCVSGKDRKGIELYHTDAMLLFRKKYGVWPKFGDPKEKEDRLKFVEILASLYTSRHQQEHAGQNAPGADGIKTPAAYLPNDVCDLIKKKLDDNRALISDDRLATDNEVKHISNEFSHYYKDRDQLLCHLIARQLGEELSNKLYDALVPLLNEKKLFIYNKNPWLNLGFFTEREEGSVPRGIKAIHELMCDASSGKNNIVRMEKIFLIVLGRPAQDASRAHATNSVYRGIRQLFEPHNDSLEHVVDKIIKEWSDLFLESKNKKASLSCYSA